MSVSDSESSSSRSGGGEYKNFRQISRARLLFEMLRSCKTGDSKSWKVLIMDRVTVKVMSCSCKMADITDEGISLVEDLFRTRQPLPYMDAIYFMQPSKEKREPLYRKAFVYFSSPISKDMIARIKSGTSVLPRIGALREMNLEYFSIDSQLAKLSSEEAKLLTNMKLLEGSDNKKANQGGFSLKLDSHKRKHAARKDRTGEETWQLFRFYPILEELLEQLSKSDLPKNEYQCMNEPSPVAKKDTAGVPSTTVGANHSGPHSMRSRRTATWAKPHGF